MHFFKYNANTTKQLKYYIICVSLAYTGNERTNDINTRNYIYFHNNERQSNFQPIKVSRVIWVDSKTVVIRNPLAPCIKTLKDV